MFNLKLSKALNEADMNHGVQPPAPPPVPGRSASQVAIKTGLDTKRRFLELMQQKTGWVGQALSGKTFTTDFFNSVGLNTQKLLQSKLIYQVADGYMVNPGLYRQFN